MTDWSCYSAFHVADLFDKVAKYFSRLELYKWKLKKIFLLNINVNIFVKPEVVKAVNIFTNALEITYLFLKNSMLFASINF